MKIKMSRMIMYSSLVFIFTAQNSFATQQLKIGIASQSAVKKESVELAFKSVFHEAKLEFHDTVAASNIAEQPVGDESGRTGAMNRLNYAKSHYPDGDALNYWVSIENYIQPSPNSEDQWVDQAVVIVQKQNREPVIEISSSVYFDHSFAAEAKLKTPPTYEFIQTGFSSTVGQIIQEKLLKEGIAIPKDDWHQHPQFGNKSRKYILQEAIIKAIIKSDIDTFSNFPKLGVDFRDISPALANPEVFASMIQLFAQKYEGENIDAIAGLDARGFVIGAPLAIQMKKPFIMIRKKKKLPRPTYSQVYQTEYSIDEIEISSNQLQDKNVLIIDDLLATGGTLKASEMLIKKSGAAKIYTACLIELLNLNGRSQLRSPFFSLLQY